MYEESYVISVSRRPISWVVLVIVLYLLVSTMLS